MPKIPTYGTSQGSTVSTPVAADLTPNGAGAVDAALGDLGEKIANIGFDLQRKRTQAQAEDYAFNTSSQRARELEQLKLQTKMESPADLEGYSQKIADWTKDTFEQDQKNAPSELAKRMYSERAGTYFNKTLIEAQGDESIARAKSYVNNIHQGIDHDASLMVQIPNDETAAYFMKDRNEQIDAAHKNGTVDGETAVLLKQRNQSVVAKGLLDGLYAKGLGDNENGRVFFQKGIDLLRGTYTGGAKEGSLGINSRNVSLDGLTPAERGEQLDRFERAMKQRKEFNAQELNNRVRDALVNNAVNGKIDPTLAPTILQSVRQGDITPEHGIRVLDSINQSNIVSASRDELAFTPARQMEGVINKYADKSAAATSTFKSDPAFASIQGGAIDQPGFEAANRESVKDQVAAAGARVVAEREKDPVAFYSRYLPALQQSFDQSGAGNSPALREQYYNQVLAVQQKSEVQNQRILSKDQTRPIAQILSGKKPEQVAGYFTIMEQQNGKFFSRALSETIDDNPGNEQLQRLWVAGLVKDPNSRQAMVANIINADAIDKSFGARFDKEQGAKINEQIIRQAEPMYRAWAGISAQGNSLERQNAFMDVVKLDAKKRMATSVRDITAEDAVRGAVANLQRDYGLSTNANSNVVYPRQVNGVIVNPQILDAFKESHLRSDAFDGMNVQVPKNVPKDRFYTDLQKYGSWVTSPSGTGMQLMFDNPITGRRDAVFDANNQPIQYDFDQISAHPDKRTYDHLDRGFIKKLWDKVF